MARRTANMVLEPALRRWALLVGAACLLPLLLQLTPALAILVAVTALTVAGRAWKQPLPTWLRGLLALAVVGVVLAMSGFNLGRDTGCAMLAAMLAIKPSETFGLRDARSLIGFALFAPFATFLLDQGPLSLALGLAAAVLALAALLRFAEVESGDIPTAPSPWRRLGGGGRVLPLGLAPVTVGVLAVSAPGVTAVGGAGTRTGTPGAVGPDDARGMAGPDERRVGRIACALFWSDAESVADVMAGAGGLGGCW